MVGHLGELAELADRCGCGIESSVTTSAVSNAARGCCSVGAITLESAAYCRRCAAALLGREVGKPSRFELL
jgi:hypothetical protein